MDFNDVDYKDASPFPVLTLAPDGQLAVAIIHRPLFPGTHLHDVDHRHFPFEIDTLRESIWIPYHLLIANFSKEHRRLCHFKSHRRLVRPASEEGVPTHKLRYSPGLLVLDEVLPHVIRYRSVEPVFAPELPEERAGAVNNVVFPTGIDRRDDLALPSRFDVYYGMADSRIGMARLDVPRSFPDGPDTGLHATTFGRLLDERLRLALIQIISRAPPFWRAAA